MPEREKKQPLLFFGWWTVLVTGIISGLGHGFNSYGLSVFFKDLASELDLNRATTSLATGIGRLEGGLIGPLTGWLSDRIGPRWPTFVGICIAATGMVLMYFITDGWHYFIVWGLLLGMGLNVGLTISVDKALNDWFLRRRGLAQGIKFALIGVFGIVVLQAITPLVLTQGWRMTSLIWGMVMFACAPLALAFVRKERPEHYGLLPDGATLSPDGEEGKDEVVTRGAGYISDFQETEYSFRQAIRTRTYWMLTIAFGAQEIIVGGFTIHVIPFLTDLGIDPITASGMMGIMVFFTIPARLFGGIIADRIRKNHLRFLLAGAVFIQGIGIAIFLLFPNTPSLYFLLACQGFGSGIATPAFLLILGRFFGRKAFGSIFGSTGAFRAPLSFIAPIFTGWIYDTTGSYTTALITFVILASLSTLVMIMVRAPRQPTLSI
ncbi:MFS transporter [Chloroflexota bacterium]